MRTILVLLFVVAGISLIGSIGYFYYSMKIGDTTGLKEKLKGLDGVAAVGNYRVYEGNAFFKLILDNGGVLELGGVGNKDLIKTNGIVIKGVDNHRIICRRNDISLVTHGIRAEKIQEQYLPWAALQNVQSVVKSYAEIKEVIFRMPLKFKSLISVVGENDGSEWTCYMKKEKVDVER